MLVEIVFSSFKPIRFSNRARYTALCTGAKFPMNKESAVFWNSYYVYMYLEPLSQLFNLSIQKNMFSTSVLDISALVFLPYIRLNFLS